MTGDTQLVQRSRLNILIFDPFVRMHLFKIKPFSTDPTIHLGDKKGLDI